MTSGFKQQLPATVRRAGPADAGALVALCVEHARYERAAYDPNGKAARLEQVLSGASSRLTVWVAEANGTAVGYVSATNEFSTWSVSEFLHMDCLFVREGYRGLGVGAMLMATLVGYARKRGYAEIQWQTPDWNTDAERFYRREGGLAQRKFRFSLAVVASAGRDGSFSAPASSS